MNGKGSKRKQGGSFTSPEELSRRITIVDARGRLAGLMGLVLVAAIIAWSLFGSVPEMVAGSGILIPPGGLMDVVALGQGQVTEVEVGPGDRVNVGDILARISMPELEAQRQSVLADLENARLWGEERADYHDRTMSVQGRNNAERIEQLRFRMKYLNEYFSFLKKFVKGLEGVKKDYLTPKEVEESRRKMQSVLAEIHDCKLKIAEVQAAELDLAGKFEQDRLQSREKETGLTVALENVDRQLKLFSRVRSPYEGVVVELGVESGDYVSPGTPLVALRPLDPTLEAGLVFPVEIGKKIRPGMKVYIYPSTAPKEEYGCIYGLVSSVSEYPVSAESLMQSLGTSHLVSSLMEQGVLLKVEVTLLRDPDTPTGFKWSSSQGPETGAIEAGTLCTGNVVLKRSRPIDLVFPKLSRMLGLVER